MKMVFICASIFPVLMNIYTLSFTLYSRVVLYPGGVGSYPGMAEVAEMFYPDRAGAVADS